MTQWLRFSSPTRVWFINQAPPTLDAFFINNQGCIHHDVIDNQTEPFVVQMLLVNNQPDPGQ